ncbi:MAG: homogentisate 1,2-dioxygenase [Candidatus Rokubacteria bacterium]|nr:homogentisate 1,2-dioxygenase [Candidatus Rokubacteria bacterium]MBI3826826.1 homogentisate 1,2-dioxygenase [Candidatus Rokubacteria bacterium]
MDKFEYFSGTPEVGIVPRAPHAGPLLRHVYEQEHGRGGFAGKVSHTYHLYPPANWLATEARVLEPATFAPRWDGAMRPIGGTHHVLDVLRPEAAADVYRGMTRLVANASVAMNVTAPAAPMEYFFEHHSASLVYFVHQGGGTLETTFGPIEFGRGDFLIVPKGITHRFELATGPQYYWVYESFAGDPEKAEAPTTGQFITHSRSDYRFPRSLDTRNEAGRFEIVSKVDGVYTRRVHPTHPFDVVGWRGDYLPYRFAVEDVRPLVADRSHVPPSGHTIFKLPGCYLCVFTVRSVEKDAMWLPFFHRNLDYLETLAYHFGDFFSAGGMKMDGMVTLHPVGLPHGPKPPALQRFMDGHNPGVHRELAVMADFANPTHVSQAALGLSRPGYMQAWAGYTTDPRFVHRPDRLAEVRALAERLADARDELRPREDESPA